MSADSVIVFGATGSVGSIVARTARSLGAKVYLAVRNTEKKIPKLDLDGDDKDGYEKLYADLTKPDTISAAVNKTNAKRAFIYLAHGMQDHMKATLEALRSAGVEFVVFLSSYTIQKELEDVAPVDMIPYIHAQVEINLKAVFGPDGYLAVRPGYFATNSLRWNKAINEGELKIFCPDLEFDFITPDDMGRVCAYALAKNKREGLPQHLYLCGPTQISQGQAAIIIGEELGEQVKVTSVGEEEGVQELAKDGAMPLPVAKYLLGRLKSMSEGQEPVYTPEFCKEASENVQKYTGTPATGFRDWVKENKQLYHG